MKKMTLVEQAVLDRLRQKQIAQEIQQPELSAMVKIRAQIEDTLNNSKLTDAEKLDILERAQEKYGKLDESVRPTHPPIMEQAAAEPGSVEVTPSTAPMFQSLKLPANRSKKFAKFLKFVDDNPNLLAKNEQNEMILEGNRLAGSNFDHLIRNLYVAKSDYNLTGIGDLTHALSKAKLSPSAISNSKFKTLVSPSKSPQFHSPQAKSPPKSAPSSPISTETAHPLAPPNPLKHGRPQDAAPRQTGPSSKTVKAGHSLAGKGRIPPGKRPRMLKLYR